MSETILQTTKLFKIISESNCKVKVLQGGTGCFVGDTLVKTHNGYSKIKDIKNGDLVLSYDEQNNKLVFNKVINKFIYECEHTYSKRDLIRFKLKDETITCTKSHKFYSEGLWRTAEELSKRVMERYIGDTRKLQNKQSRKNKNNELEMHWKRKNNASREIEQIYKNNYNKKQDTKKCFNSQISSKCIYSKSTDEARSKPYRRETLEQQCRKSRVGNSFREYITCLHNRIRKTNERLIKRNGKINRIKGFRNKEEIQAKNIYGKNISKRIWSKLINNKRYSIQKEKQDFLVACEINLSEIEEIYFIKSNEVVYDLSVEHTKNYCITKNNLIVHNSSKTYQILIYLIWNSHENWQDETIDIIRRTMPAMQMGAMKDFFDILKKVGWYDEINHNKTHNTYQLGSNLFRFYASDDEKKMRGPRRSRAYFNEVLEMKKMDVLQVMTRTKKEIIFDYNPSEEFHWFYDTILTRKDILFHKSTFIDNPFLSENEIKEIKNYKETDAGLWRIYGLGERGVTKAKIYSNWDYAQISYDEFDGEELFGLDFGYNHPCALVRIKYYDKSFISDELIYKSELTGDKLALELDKLREAGKLTYNDEIIADSSRPEMIKTLREYGYNVRPTNKGPNSVIQGIDFIKKKKHYVTKESVNTVKELRTYRYKTDKDDEVTEEPVKINDDLMDAIRYALEKKVRRRKEIGIA